MPGFVKLLTAADIPPGGRNNFFSPKVDPVPEEVCYNPKHFKSTVYDIITLLGIS